MRDDGPDSLIADLVTVIVGPILIMGMVGGLAFFLLDIAYAGPHLGRLRFIMALFTMAIVLIGRISMTEGYDKAMLYAAALAAATCLAIVRFIDRAALGSMVVVFVIWWFAHKLTWDCTFDDLASDTTDVGLLEKAGLDPEADQGRKKASVAKKGLFRRRRGKRAGADDPDEAPDGTTSTGHDPPGFWRRLLLRDRRVHAPGVWILYFSLAALPLFGLGQLMLPAGDTARRASAFTWLLLYTASGLGLLLITSFLALRRYLHKRKARMPVGVATAWVVAGPVLILVILAIALLLPRPGVHDSLSESSIALEFTSPELEESSVQVGRDGADTNREGETSAAQGTREDDNPSDDSGRAGRSPGGEAGESSRGSGSQGGRGGDSEGGSDGRSQGKQGGDASSNQSPTESEASGESQSSEGATARGAKETSPDETDPQGSEGQAGGRRRSAEGQGGNQPGGNNERRESSASSAGPRRSEQQNTEQNREAEQREAEQEESEQQEEDQSGGGSASEKPSSFQMPRPSFSFSGNWLVAILKLLLYVAIAIGVLYILWRHGRAVLDGLRDFKRMFREFWAGLFGRKGAAAPGEEAETEAPPLEPVCAPFAAFRDPFLAGATDAMRPESVVRYTFEALEAWASEHGVPRSPDRTPHEFTTAVGQRFPQLEKEARGLAFLYVHAAYSPATLPRERVAKLRHLWYLMDRLKRMQGSATPPPEAAEA